MTKTWTAAAAVITPAVTTALAAHAVTPEELGPRLFQACCEFAARIVADGMTEAFAAECAAKTYAQAAQ